VCQNVRTLWSPKPAGPISEKFGRKAQLNHVDKIAIVLYLEPRPWERGGLKTLTAELFTEQKMFKFHLGNAGYPQLLFNMT